MKTESTTAIGNFAGAQSVLELAKSLIGNCILPILVAVCAWIITIYERPFIGILLLPYFVIAGLLGGATLGAVKTLLQNLPQLDKISRNGMDLFSTRLLRVLPEDKKEIRLDDLIALVERSVREAQNKLLEGTGARFPLIGRAKILLVGLPMKLLRKYVIDKIVTGVPTTNGVALVDDVRKFVSDRLIGGVFAFVQSGVRGYQFKVRLLFGIALLIPVVTVYLSVRYL